MVVVDGSIVQLANYYVMCKYHAVQSDITAEALARKVSEAIYALEMSTGARSAKRPMILVLDRGSSWRKALDNRYKFARVGNEHYASIRLEAEEILAQSFTTFVVPGLEADDLAYILTKNFSNVTLVSNDGDFKSMVRGHGHSWMKYSDKSVFRLPNEHSIAVDVAVRNGLEKAFLGCPTDGVAPIFREAQYERFAACIRDMDMVYKEEFLKTGVPEDALTFMCMMNALDSRTQGYLLDNYFLTGYSEMNYQLFCPHLLAQANAWIDENRALLASPKKINLF